MAQIGIAGNAAVKSIAEDTKMVAIATLRDSAAMRTIAAVTIFFLPATFTAVCVYFKSKRRDSIDFEVDFVQHDILQFSEHGRLCRFEMGLALLVDDGNSYRPDQCGLVLVDTKEGRGDQPET
jgi:hypothetical protein